LKSSQPKASVPYQAPPKFSDEKFRVANESAVEKLHGMLAAGDLNGLSKFESGSPKLAAYRDHLVARMEQAAAKGIPVTVTTEAVIPPKVLKSTKSIGQPHPHVTKEAAYAAAAETKPKFDAAMTEVITALGGKPAKFGELPTDGTFLLLAPLKGEVRATEKATNKYGGNWGKMADLVRGTVGIQNVADLPKTMSTLVSVMEKNGFKLAEMPDNRFENPTNAGYRDFQCKFTAPNGLNVELQINTRSMLDAKEGPGGHDLYNVARKLDEGAKVAPDPAAYMKAHAAEYDELANKMKALYDGAWKQSLGAKG